LKGQAPLQSEAFAIICGTSQKRKGQDKPSDGTLQDKQRRKLTPRELTSPKKPTPTPLYSNRLIVPMMIQYGTKNPIAVHALLDTGCTTPFISNTFVDRWHIPYLRQKNVIAIQNLTGDIVK